MAAEVKVTGQKKISTLQAEFTECYPYLGLMFFTEEEFEKSKAGEKIRPLNPDQTIASVRTRTTGEDISMHGRTHVGTIENAFLEGYGLYVQICKSEGGKRKYTGGGYDSMSLTEISRKGEADGWDKWSYARP
ncbi:MAG: hypothetical protein CMJ33_07635 [Phycisphaerae bacterium]|nr:hypothetical protein [Phycisphaerae bacterium]HAW96651.1 hypothetical protein [Phycisphaerales bacterium]|tara:strand:- start:52 stop:450 length:399 start_codon:yes stop_codon:yes gene_type:complete